MSEGVSLGRGRVTRASDAAINVYLDDYDRRLWVPKSVVHDDSEVFSFADGEDEGEVVVEQWWAEKKGLV